MLNSSFTIFLGRLWEKKDHNQIFFIFFLQILQNQNPIENKRKFAQIHLDSKSFQN